MKYLIIPVILLAGWLFYANQSNLQTPEPAGTNPADHIIRITALLEFDGKPVVVDELVTCLTEGAARRAISF